MKEIWSTLRGKVIIILCLICFVAMYISTYGRNVNGVEIESDPYDEVWVGFDDHKHDNDDNEAYYDEDKGCWVVD